MRRRLPWFTTVLVAATGLLPQAGLAQAVSEAHTHIWHVRDAFARTPNGEGLLTVALADAAVVAQHARLAASGDPTNIDPMIQHARHVLHAIDPAEFPNGPGSGFGLRVAAQGIVQHIELAAASEGASSSVQTHAGHVAAAARATVQRADRMVDLARQVLAAGDYARAYPLVGELALVGEALMTGEDADGDGTISLEGDAGLSHVERHLSLMADAEGL